MAHSGTRVKLSNAAWKRLGDTFMYMSQYINYTHHFVSKVV